MLEYQIETAKKDNHKSGGENVQLTTQSYFQVPVSGDAVTPYQLFINVGDIPRVLARYGKPVRSELLPAGEVAFCLTLEATHTTAIIVSKLICIV